MMYDVCCMYVWMYVCMCKLDRLQAARWDFRLDG